MASTAWTYPGTVVAGLSTTAVVGSNWTFANPNNVKLDNATASIGIGVKMPGTEPGECPELRTSNYGFAIPAGATIVGIETRIEGYTDNNRVGEKAFLSNPSYIGTLKADEWTDMSTDNATPTYGTHAWGSSTDLWGATLTPAIVNGTNFGWSWMVYDDIAPMQAGVDYMQLKVHYELAATPPIIMMIGA